jgi:catechol 2,3-dioxygenase-like lactoylglutathione lyase family enzyme
MARLIGINHVALEVGDLTEALAFYGRLVEFELRGRIGDHMAFLDAGDQFIALSAPRIQPPDDSRHFGLVVDNCESVRAALHALDVEALPGRGLSFRDPWGNHVQVVQYGDIQFTKAAEVLRGMDVEGLSKSASAQRELRDKGLAG